MAMADFFVQPGWPGAFNDYRFPSKLPEFFSIGRPVILPATNLGRFIEHGVDAWILPQADAQSITDAIIHLKANPALVQTLSNGALAFTRRNFCWARSTDKLVEFYRSLTELKPPQHIGANLTQS